MDEPEGALGSQFSDRLRGEPVDQAELERPAAALEKARQAYAIDHPAPRQP